MAHTDTKTKTKTNMRRCTKATREGRSFVINLNAQLSFQVHAMMEGNLRRNGRLAFNLKNAF